MGNVCKLENDENTFDYFQNRYNKSGDSSSDFPTESGYLLAQRNDKYQRVFVRTLYFQGRCHLYLPLISN